MGGGREIFENQQRGRRRKTIGNLCSLSLYEYNDRVTAIYNRDAPKLYFNIRYTNYNNNLGFIVKVSLFLCHSHLQSAHVTVRLITCLFSLKCPKYYVSS